MMDDTENHALHTWATVGTGGDERAQHCAPISRIAAFGPNTHIMTPEGEIPVEWLATGDRLITRDHGAQPILWIQRTRLDAAALAIAPETTPISIAQGALGQECPTHPTWLAACTRVLLSGASVELYAGVDEALCEISHLKTSGQIDETPACGDLCYTHILLPMHEVVEANGLWAETLHLDPVARFVLADSLPPVLLADPDIAHDHRQTARTCLDPWEVTAMRGRRDRDAAAKLIRRVA